MLILFHFREGLSILKTAAEMVKAFLNTGFEGGRRIHRINKIPISE